MQIPAPRTCREDWSDALRRARSELEPIFVPITPFTDERGWSLMNLLAGVMSEQGQINFSVQYPDVVKAWHRHDHQTDFWCCVTGHLKVGIHRESDGRCRA